MPACCVAISVVPRIQLSEIVSSEAASKIPPICSIRLKSRSGRAVFVSIVLNVGVSNPMPVLTNVAATATRKPGLKTVKVAPNSPPSVVMPKIQRLAPTSLPTESKNPITKPTMIPIAINALFCPALPYAKLTNPSFVESFSVRAT